jgi:hypothetical protein
MTGDAVVAEVIRFEKALDGCAQAECSCGEKIRVPLEPRPSFRCPACGYAGGMKMNWREIEEVAATYFASVSEPVAEECQECAKPAVVFLEAGCCPGCGSNLCEACFLEEVKHTGEGSI